MTEDLKPLQVYPADDLATLRNKVTKLVVYAEQVEHQRDQSAARLQAVRDSLRRAVNLIEADLRQMSPRSSKEVETILRYPLRLLEAVLKEGGA